MHTLHHDTALWPHLTVALPLFRARRIAWLALESLCRQKHAPHWELLMSQEAAEAHEPVPLNELQAYVPRLAAAGCVRVVLLQPGVHQALSLKWRDLRQHASLTSHTFLLQAADCYSHHLRLATSHSLIMDHDADWVHQHTGLFVDPIENRRAEYRHPPGYPTALNMAVRTSLLHGLPREEVRKGVDRWLYQHATRTNGGPLVVQWLPAEHRGLDTHGLNNISRKRGQKIALRTVPFHHTKLRVADVLPAELVPRLQALRKPQYT